MNFLVKHLVVNYVTAVALKGATLGAERLLAKYRPDAHEQYVDYISELWDAKIEAFVKRNADLVDPAVAEARRVKEEVFNAAQEQINSLFNRMTKGFTDEK